MRPRVYSLLMTHVWETSAEAYCLYLSRPFTLTSRQALSDITQSWNDAIVNWIWQECILHAPICSGTPNSSYPPLSDNGLIHLPELSAVRRTTLVISHIWIAVIKWGASLEKIPSRSILLRVAEKGEALPNPQQTEGGAANKRQPLGTCGDGRLQLYARIRFCKRDGGSILTCNQGGNSRGARFNVRWRRHWEFNCNNSPFGIQTGEEILSFLHAGVWTGGDGPSGYLPGQPNHDRELPGPPRSERPARLQLSVISLVVL